MLSAILLYAVARSKIMLDVIMLNVVVLSVIMLSALMLGTLSIKGLFETLSKDDNQYNNRVY